MLVTSASEATSTSATIAQKRRASTTEELTVIEVATVDLMSFSDDGTVFETRYASTEVEEVRAALDS